MPAASTTPAFPLIANPQQYRPNTIDMSQYEDIADYWITLFEEHTHITAAKCIESHNHTTDAQQRAARFIENFLAELKRIRNNPNHFDNPLTILDLCRARLHHYTEMGFEDPFKPLKEKENELALQILPTILKDLDQTHEDQQLLTLIRGIFAGNIFDMGAKETIELYESGQIDFQTVRNKIQRPFFIDDFDTLQSHFTSKSYSKAVMFVDNAGSDVFLGMLPFARHLIQRGTTVILTANTIPALNDITHDELTDTLNHIRQFDTTIDTALTNNQLQTIPSGNDLPVIDLNITTDALNQAATDADLLVLEGMGRALETNFNTRFTCDTLKLAMIKDKQVKEHFGAQLYDVVCRFEPGEE